MIEDNLWISLIFSLRIWYILIRCICLISFSGFLITFDYLFESGNAQEPLWVFKTPDQGQWEEEKGLTPVVITQGSTAGRVNYSLQGQSDCSVFANKALWKHSHVHSFTYCQWQFSHYKGRVVYSGQTLWSAKPKIFAIGPFIEKLSWPLIYYNKVAKLF